MIRLVKSGVKDLIYSRELMCELIRRDQQQQNQGSYFGWLWNYLQPMLFVFVLFSVFTLGFKEGSDSDGLPFSIYLVSGVIPWIYFSSNLTAITGVIKSYSFLVKKVDFRLSLLPVVKIVGSFFPHLVLIGCTLLLCGGQGVDISWSILQLPYYYMCMVLLLLGAGWLTSSTSIFIKDISNVVSVVTQFGFWLTPIFWDIENMPENIQWLLQLNPAYYVVSGYRQSISGEYYFWQRDVGETVAFWGVTLVLLVLGSLVYRRLKPHFAEVL